MGRQSHPFHERQPALGQPRGERCGKRSVLRDADHVEQGRGLCLHRAAAFHYPSRRCLRRRESLMIF